MNRNILFLAVALLVSSLAVFAAESTSSGQIESPEMNLTVDNSLPANFRGGDPDSGVVHVLEDAVYKRMEHTLLYEDSTEGLGAAASGTTFDGPPTINWTTEKVDANGNLTTIANDNNNSATSESEFPEPGEYQVGNSGARQVSGGSAETSGSDSGSTAQSGASDQGATGQTGNAAAGQQATGQNGAAATGQNGAAATGQDGAAAAGQRVTSTQTMGVKCHDVTSPNLWVVFQEGAGKTDLAASEKALQEELAAQMEAAKGTFTPETKLDGSLAEASVLSVYEFPKNVKPTEKTAAVALKGPVFDESGKPVAAVSAEVKAQVLDKEAQTRKVEVGEQALKGIYIRRNVPFLVAAQITDNGEYKKDAASFRIENKETGEPVEKVDGAFLFRVPNYPRAEYADQPVYQFVMEGKDDSGNLTEVKVPLYVVNTAVSYEGGQNQ
ncbi:MAG: hypothetical protein GX442_17755 [Candidatus Riflebacteria bacterium]|nr:hypothetical protein [Candidatus Riflebacteria bacterium]